MNNKTDLIGDEVEFKPDDEWFGMPEFSQEKKEPFKKLIVRFETEEDLKEFANLISQKITKKTKSIWHPHKPHRLPKKGVYIYES